MRRREGEWLVVVSTVKHRVGGGMMWTCLAGDAVGKIFKTQGTVYQHSAVTGHPIWSVLCGTIIRFSTGQGPKTHLQA